MNYMKVSANDTDTIKVLSDLATTIVKEHYDSIIGVEQNDYMVRKFQSVSAITKQLECGYQYYFVCDVGGERVGFIGFYLRKNYLYLSKFYLQKSQRGKGIAKDMLKFIIQQSQKYGFSSIILNVNKKNSAILIYEKLGFKKVREEKIDIGNGFYMDDFVYEYLIKQTSTKQ